MGHEKSKVTHKLSSRGDMGKVHLDIKINGKEEVKEPSGVRVNENTQRNLERGEACSIDIDKLRHSEEGSPKKKESK